MKLIDQEALLNAKIPLPTEEEFSTDNMVDFLCGMEWVGKYVKEMPTIEVVRCKECKSWGGVTFGNICRRWSAPLAGMKNCTGPDDFCSYGERKET